MSTNYPLAFDNDTNLYLVQDALQVPLGLDYYPGHSIIVAESDISKFPLSGIITLVDQCSSPLERAVSLYYGRRTNREFLDLELLSIDCFKPKKLTKITMQVMADHREALKSSIIAIEKVLGPKHEDNNTTIFGRLNSLRKVLFAPKAWFETEKTTGTAPFTTKFNFAGTGNSGPVGDVIYTWKFGEETRETKEPEVEKVFLTPGNYTISLTIKNHYGEDSVSFVDMINVKNHAPEETPVKFLPLYNQLHFADIVPKIRTPVGQIINVEAPLQPVEDNKKDKIVNYTWNLGDDLPHGNSTKTKALFTIGGLYDLTLRTDTERGAYRITTYENCIDVVEPSNLWLWTIENKQSVRSYEFGLISETMKTSNNVHSVNINDSFIENNQRQKFEFWRNNGAATRGELKSGQGGSTLLFWASGRKTDESSATEKINLSEYNGFTDIYTAKSPISRPWNWAALSSKEEIYFVLGTSLSEPLPTVSMTNQTKTTYDMAGENTNNEQLSYRNYKSGAHELMQNPGVFDENYNAKFGHFSTYRSTWKDNMGYILRNSELGEYFSFQNFYRTDGTLGQPFQSLIKLQDVPGDNHKEGSLVALAGGVYYFNNYGNAYCYNDHVSTWEVINSHNRIARHDLDSLLAASDLNSKAYINIENIAFFKFNEVDMSYATFSHKPLDKPWLMTIF